MPISDVIKTYIKEFYEVSYYPKEKQILLHDLPESQKSGNKIDIGRVGRVKITLMWGKIEEITGVQYHHKEFQSELSKFLYCHSIVNLGSITLFLLLIKVISLG